MNANALMLVYSQLLNVDKKAEILQILSFLRLLKLPWAYRDPTSLCCQCDKYFPFPPGSLDAWSTL